MTHLLQLTNCFLQKALVSLRIEQGDNSILQKIPDLKADLKKYCYEFSNECH